MFLAFVFSCLAVVCLLLYFIRRRKLRLPPGPPGYPLLGNIKELIRGAGRRHAWVEYAELGEKYGDVVYLEALGQRMVILNSAEASFDLLEKRSYNYSGRPISTMMMELVGWDYAFVLMDYSDRWRVHRKTFHRYFQQCNIPTYRPVIQRSVHKFLRQLLTSPEEFRSHVYYYTGSIILKLTYDYEMQADNDPYISLYEEAMESAIAILRPGSFLVDLVPALKYVPAWVPGARFQHKARTWKKAVLRLADVPFESVKKRIARDYATGSFVEQSLQTKLNSAESTEDTEVVVKNCAGVAFLAGGDSSTSTLLSFILAMVLNPAVLQKAQAEMDSVVGCARLPDFNDRPQLPYLEAVYLETFRWMPATPLAVAHKSAQDDIYNGYHIPKGTTIIGNSWAMLHDPVTYPEPSEFRPERWLPDESKGIPPLPMNFAFGFGRRICPGRYFAMEVVWLAIANVVAAFDIGKAKDLYGNDIIPVADGNDTAVSHPLPFKCSITPRSTQVVHLLEKGRAED